MLDFTGDEGRTGKPIANDFTQGIYTLPIIYTLQDKRLGPTLKETLQSPLLNISDIQRIMEMVHASGGIKYSTDLINRYIHKSEKIIQALPHSEYKAILIDLLNNINPGHDRE